MFTDEETLPWIKEKIRKTTSHKIEDNGDLYGAMHCLCSDHRSMEVYIKAYKCDEKQGVIVNLHRGLSDAIASLECLKVDSTDLREHLKRAEQALGLAESAVEPLAEKVRKFRVARAAALVAVQEAYPIGSDVRMLRNDVKATVFKHSADSPDCLDLLFENGNVWTKSVDQIERV